MDKIMNAKTLKQITKSVFAVLLIAALTGIVSCKKTVEPTPTPEPQPAKYTIKGTVTNQGTGSLLSGVLVTMRTVVDGPSLTQTTTSTGAFEFTNLSVAGKYILTLSKDQFFSSTYSLEFAAVEPNNTVVYTISAAMIPYVPGITPLNPITGGQIPVTGDIAATLTIPAGTTVRDINGVIITGTINITAVPTPDIVIAGAVNNPGLITLRFEPSGLQFSNPLPLVVDNPLTGYRFPQIQLEFFNVNTSLWEKQAQPVAFVASTNDYATTISHFSQYKFSVTNTYSELAPTEQIVEVTDSVIRNFSLVNLSVTKLRYKRFSGYKLEQPILTSLSAVGITGTDATGIAIMLTNLVKGQFNGADPVTQFAVNPAEITVSRIILPRYKLLTTGKQKIVNTQFSIQVVKLSDNTIKTVIIKVNSADMVTLDMQDKIFDAHDHGLGGGGTN